MSLPKPEKGHEWLTTMPNPRVVSHTADAGQRGWRVHAVKVTPDKSTQDIKRLRALCGLRPAHGWGVDLFIEEPCARCGAALEKLASIETK